MSHTRSKIINVADDFGISQTANRNILKLVRHHKIDRVSVLVNHDPNNLKEQDIKELLAEPVELYVHLDYQDFYFIKPDRKLKEGVAGRSLNFCLGYLLGKGSPKKVERAWEQQIQRFIELFGRVPDGLNSHQHIHFFPLYFRVLMKLAKKYHISHIRFGSKGLVNSRHKVYLALKMLWMINVRWYRSYDCTSTDYLVSLDWIENIDHFFEKCPKGTIEVVFHPEREDEFETVMQYF